MRRFLCLTSIIAVGYSFGTSDGESSYDPDVAPPGFNTPIPKEIMTPDVVYLPQMGTLNFFDGVPDKKTAEKCYDHLDYIRAVDCFLNLMPGASTEAIRFGMIDLGLTTPQDVLMFSELLDSSSLFLTGNTDTVYISAFLDLKTDGATVVEVPAGLGPTTIDDAMMRYVVDLGPTGPDRGQGGKYIILPPDYEGDIDPTEKTTMIDGEQYYVAKSITYRNWVIGRGFLVDGSPEFSDNLFRTGLKIYPLSQKSSPPPMNFMSASGKYFNTIHANTEYFYDEIYELIQYEPIGMLESGVRGQLNSIGLTKGKPFKPDARRQQALIDGAKAANAISRTLMIYPRDPEAYLYGLESMWTTCFLGGSYQWLVDDGMGGKNRDGRAYFHYMATVNTPAMVEPMIGKGSQYAMVSRDSTGEALDGGESYTINLPKDVPAKDFWSIVVYDTQTRSQLQSDQLFPSINSKLDADTLKINSDGSVDIYFGPTAPDGKEDNWIQTVPGKSWFTYLRLYGPLEEWFDKSWRPGELVQFGD